jgi:hypothetical protein
MSPRPLARVLWWYALALCVSALCIRAIMHLDPQRAPTATRIVSVWKGGERVARAIVHDDSLPSTDACDPGACTRIVERVVDQGPLPTAPPLLFALSIAAGRDGIAVELGDRKLYLTPDDLLAQQASQTGARVGSLELRVGLDDPAELLDRIASELEVGRAELLARARLSRFIVRREDATAELWPLRAARTEALRPAMLEQAVRSAAEYLARNQTEAGRFVYQIDAVRGIDLPGYGWPRHGGTTLMLAEVAARTHDPKLTAAALRGGQLVQRELSVECGPDRCIGDSNRVDAGSAALTLLAYVELERGVSGAAFDADIRALAKFLRSLQRPDGEFMHVYDRKRRRPIDVQLPFYTGEVVLALARAYRLTHDPADLRAASAGLAHLVRRSLFQNRYQYGTEHWTCQALEELWEFAPDRAALAFCLDYQAFNRQYQVGAHSEFGDYEGGFAPNPFSPPRITPTGSRTEGAVATLSTAIAAGVSPATIRELTRQVRRSLAFLLRFQLRPGPRHLLRDPERVVGGMPGSPTDLSIRIDYQQHVAGAMLRYLRLLERHPAGS